MKGHGNVRSF